MHFNLEVKEKKAFGSGFEFPSLGAAERGEAPKTAIKQNWIYEGN
jgi:hypothetical protein